MPIHVWTNTRPVSDTYHDSGGLLVAADTLERARELAVLHFAGKRDIDITEAEWRTTDPGYTFDGAGDELVLTFPNSGCCG